MMGRFHVAATGDCVARMDGEEMSALARAASIGLPVAVLLAVSVGRLSQSRSRSAWFQLLGALCLTGVVFAHVAEAEGWFPAMGFGEAHSLGHYVDLLSAWLGAGLLMAAFVQWRRGL